MRDFAAKIRRRQQELDDAEPAQREPKAAAPAAESAVLALQRSAGNKAVSELLRSIGPDVDRPAMAVSGDRGAEAEADRVANAAVAKLGPGGATAPVAGDAIAPELRRAMAQAAPQLHHLEDVRIHTGPDAESAAESIQARAFTSGRDVTIGRGELQHPVEANRLVAHEAAHAALHQPAAPSNVVHAKLRGTRDALTGMGGGATTGAFGKLIQQKTNWDKIVDAVGAYEAIEAVLIKNGNPTVEALSKVKPQMMELLGKIERYCLDWEKANPTESKKRTQKRQEKAKTGNSEVMEQEDTRSKAPRRQAIAMLLPRVRVEMQDLQTGKWRQGLGLSDVIKVEKPSKRDEGGKNVVEEFKYVTDQGKFKGYFKEDQGFSKKMEGHEAQSGIKQTDPNYGARAVAMYRLDKLLGADVIARAEFAVHDGKLGTVLETAKGVQGSKAKFGMGEEQTKQLGPGAVDATDPIVQRGLNKLQILDAICGQLDRHMGNWVVEQDKAGKVKGIKGIDLDMAFGGDMEGVDMTSAGAQNFLGMPDMVDEEFAMRIMEIRPEDIRDALQGLISPQEVNATVKRFGVVKAKIEQVAKTSGLTKTWNAQTAEAARVKKKVSLYGHTSYQSQAGHEAVRLATADLEAALEEALVGMKPRPPVTKQRLLQLQQLPDGSRSAIVENLQEGLRSPISDALWKGTLPPDKAVTVAMEVLAIALIDDKVIPEASVILQGLTDGSSPYMAVHKIQARLAEIFAAVLEKYRR